MNLTMVLSPEEMDILIMYILIKFIRENQPALVSFAASEVGTGKGFAYQEFLDQLGAFIGPVVLFFISLVQGTGNLFSTYRLWHCLVFGQLAAWRFV